MGLLVNGQWQNAWYDTRSTGGRFVRPDTRFRNWITPDGSPGSTGSGGFPAAAGRYHLYVSYACPWAHRTLIFRKLKGLESMIGLSVTHWLMGNHGWTFGESGNTIPDDVNHAHYLYEIYLAARPDYTGRATVPMLWDKVTNTIVSNESADIIRMFNSAFDHLGAAPGNYRPEHLRVEIDAINARVYDTVNNGVYKAGFATSQQAYEEAVVPLFDTLDWLESRLSTQRYLLGATPTEADWRLFTTLLRFDPVYHTHFKCNLRRLVDYPNLWAYTRDLLQQPGIAETFHLDHIKNHYYQSHPSINPSRLVPLGPVIDYFQPHHRGTLA